MSEQALEMGVELGWQAEVTLDRSELQFRRSLEKLPVGAYTCDFEGLITYFNPQAVQLWGRVRKLNDSVDRFCGSFKLFSANGLPITHEQCWMALALQMKQGYNGHEIIIERPDGSRLVVLAYANPIQDESGKMLGAVNLLVDITERKRAELKERLLAEVSHLLVKSLEYKVALSHLVQLVVPRLADWCVIDLTGEGETGSPVIGHVDPTKIEMAHEWRRRFPIDWNAPEGVAKVVRTGQAELYPEVTGAMLQASTGDLEYLTLLRQLQFSSMMIVPLVAHGQIFGTMTFVWAESNNHYNEEDLALAEELARQAAIILDNTRSYEAERAARAEAEIAQQRLALLARAGEGLIASPDSKTIFFNLTRVIVPCLADWCVVDVMGEDGLLHRLAVVHHDPAKAELATQLQDCYPALDPQGGHTIARMLRQGQSWFDAKVTKSRLAAEARDAAHLRLLQGLGFASEMVIPLVARGRILGALTFVRSSVERHYEWADLSLAEELTRRAALVIDNARLYQAEQQARAEAEAAQQRLVLLAEMRERNRLAQELHDTVAQTLGYLNLKIGMTHSLLVDDQVEAAKANLQELKNVVGEAYTDVREEIFNLRAKIQSGMNFMEVLNRYIDKYHRFYHLDIHLVQETDPALFEFPADVTPQVIRTIQEALINIRKHAQVNTATIRLGQEGEHLRIVIEDQGSGFDPDKIKEKSSSFGLQIMRERVKSVGGSLEVETALDRGTRIILHYNPHGSDHTTPE